MRTHDTHTYLCPTAHQELAQRKDDSNETPYAPSRSGRGVRFGEPPPAPAQHHLTALLRSSLRISGSRLSAVRSTGYDLRAEGIKGSTACAIL